MKFARKLILVFALVAAGFGVTDSRAALERGINAEGFTDEYFGIEYPSQGLTGELARGDDLHLLMTGRTANGVEIETRNQSN